MVYSSNYEWYTGGLNLRKQPITSTNEENGAVKLNTVCSIHQWSRDPPYNNVEWYENDINNTPSFAVHPKTLGTITSDNIGTKPEFLQDNLPTTSFNHGTDPEMRITFSTPYPKVKYIYIYYNFLLSHMTSPIPRADWAVTDVNGNINPNNGSMAALIPNTGPTCCTVVKYVLPDNTTIRSFRLRTQTPSDCKIFGVRMTPYPAVPSPINYITVQSTFNKDPAFFQKYSFTPVSQPNITLGQYLNPDLFPNSYSGRRIYAPHINTAVWKQHQYYYIIDHDAQPEAQTPNVSWGGLGYANEADAIGPGKWEKLYDLYAYWLDGTLAQFQDQNNNYWYRRLQSYGTVKYP